MSSAYPSAPATPIGASSRPPGRFSLSTSPTAISAPNATAILTSRTPAAAVCATEATSTIPAAATSSSRPESRTCQGTRRSSCRGSAIEGSAAVGHPQRRGGIEVGCILPGGQSRGTRAKPAALLAVGSRGGKPCLLRRPHPRTRGRRDGTLPALAPDRGDEGVHERRVELGARPPPQLRDRLVDRARAAVGPGG